MRCAWQVELDQHAQDVARFHWPDVERHPDVSTAGSANLAPVDLICGGFPCQDVSVAGRRAGLAGERSGLFWQLLRVVGEIRPRWVLLENVGGLLSSNGWRDLGAVLGALGECGYWWTYRCLDSQHFGVPQRRYRIFIVGHLGGPCPPEILLEPDCLPGDSAARREARKDVAVTLTQGAESGGRGGYAGRRREDDVNLVARPLLSKARRDNAGDENLAAFSPAAHGNYGPPGQLRANSGDLSGGSEVLIANTLDTRCGEQTGRDMESGASLIVHTLRAEGHDASEDGTGRGTPLVAVPRFIHPRQLRNSQSSNQLGIKPDALISDSLTGEGPGAVMVPLAFNWQSGGDCRINASDEGTDALSVGQVPAVGFAINQRREGRLQDVAGTVHAPSWTQVEGAVTPMGVRRLTPTECEALQGLPRHWTRYGRREDGSVYELKDAPRYRLLGNAVTATVARWIGSRIMAASGQLRTP